MSTNKTQNYKLHSWVAADDFLRAEINENFTKLDDALNTGISGLAAGLGEKIGVVIGTYTGRQSSPEPSTRRIELGFRPRMVLLANSESLNIGVLAIDQTVAGAKWVVIDDKGFTIYHGLYSTDLAKYTYLYAAFR